MAIKTRVSRNAASDFMGLREAFYLFLEEKQANNLSQATLKSYEESFIKFMNFFEFDEETTTEEITQSLVFEWIGEMRLENLTVNSINHYLRDIRAFFYWCMDDTRQYIKPMFKIKLLTVQEEIPKCFPDEDLELLLDKPGKRESFSRWRIWAIVNWVLGTANRASTICNVKIGDVDFKRKEISIRVTKNNKVQVLPLSSALETALKEYIRMWRYGAPDDSYLFCNIGDDKLTTHALRQAFRKYCLNRGVNQTNIHGLRHNFARDWVRNEGNMFKLQQILGHATLDMTKKYVKLFCGDIKEDFDKFNPLDNIKRKAKRTQTVTRRDF